MSWWNKTRQNWFLQESQVTPLLTLVLLSPLLCVEVLLLHVACCVHASPGRQVKTYSHKTMENYFRPFLFINYLQRNFLQPLLLKKMEYLWKSHCCPNKLPPLPARWFHCVTLSDHTRGNNWRTIEHVGQTPKFCFVVCFFNINNHCLIGFTRRWLVFAITTDNMTTTAAVSHNTGAKLFYYICEVDKCGLYGFVCVQFTQIERKHT